MPESDVEVITFNCRRSDNVKNLLRSSRHDPQLSRRYLVCTLIHRPRLWLLALLSAKSHPCCWLPLRDCISWTTLDRFHSAESETLAVSESSTDSNTVQLTYKTKKNSDQITLTKSAKTSVFIYATEWIIISFTRGIVLTYALRL